MDTRGTTDPAGNTRMSPGPAKPVTVKFTEIATARSGIPHWVTVPVVVPVIWNVRSTLATRAGGPNWPVNPWLARVSTMRQGVMPTNDVAPVTSAADAVDATANRPRPKPRIRFINMAL